MLIDILHFIYIILPTTPANRHAVTAKKIREETRLSPFLYKPMKSLTVNTQRDSNWISRKLTG
jgi:hypothetical protein